MPHGPDWYDGVALGMILPKCLGRACWAVARELVKAHQAQMLPADPTAIINAVFAREAPEATRRERAAALAMAELLQEWAERREARR